MEAQYRKPVYVKLESVIDAIQKIKQEHTETWTNTTDVMKHAFESARIGVLTDVHIAVICDLERFTAEQVATENAETMVNELGDEAEVKQILNFIHCAFDDDIVDHILVQGHDRRGWTDLDVFCIEDLIDELKVNATRSEKTCPSVYLYNKTSEGATLAEIGIDNSLLSRVAQCLEAKQ